MNAKSAGNLWLTESLIFLEFIIMKPQTNPEQPSVEEAAEKKVQ
jgi:hypothetical protein